MNIPLQSVFRVILLLLSQKLLIAEQPTAVSLSIEIQRLCPVSTHDATSVALQSHALLPSRQVAHRKVAHFTLSKLHTHNEASSRFISASAATYSCRLRGGEGAEPRAITDDDSSGACRTVPTRRDVTLENAPRRWTGGALAAEPSARTVC
jgi:hypothetical protein